MPGPSGELGMSTWVGMSRGGGGCLLPADIEPSGVRRTWGATRYGQQAGDTYPTGMLSCVELRPTL